ncbi:hypothetical protein HHI36_005484 [Cryptolaemus montrouzieri]|uniref:Uncharacterized protein n=1 Tax=Cryptolaemus montrouzieri TaxID=559131 RepID=A0ABD2NUG5_9CUCU
MNFNVYVLSILLFLRCSSSAPVMRKGYILVPIRDRSSASEAKQGGIIASWIQNSQFFPIEINVPDLISNASNGIQNVGQGIQSFGQNLSQGYQTWITNLGERFPIINRLPIPGLQQNQGNQKYLILIPLEGEQNSNQVVSKPTMNDLLDSVDIFAYP